MLWRFWARLVLILASKRLLTRLDFQRKEGLEATRSGHSANKKFGMRSIAMVTAINRQPCILSPEKAWYMCSTNLLTILCNLMRVSISMKLVIPLLLTLTLNSYAIFTYVARADEAEIQDNGSAETVDSVEVSGGADKAEMAKKLANPLAAMISIPMQLNYDQDFGVEDTGNRFLINVQPVVPISVSENWNLISHTILPVNFMVSKLLRFDKQLVSFQGGIRYWIKSTDSGPEGLGLRFAVTLLFPK